MICAGWGREPHSVSALLAAETWRGELKLCLDCLKILCVEPERERPVPYWFDDWSVRELENAREKLGILHTEGDLQIVDGQGNLKSYFGFTPQGALIMDPVRRSVCGKNKDWGKWQKTLKILAYLNQGYKCVCGAPGYTGDLHHALVTRRDVQGWRQPWRIHHSFNVIYCHQQCHARLTREKSHMFLKSLYGSDFIGEWLAKNNSSSLMGKPYVYNSAN